jgi:hypothetical protein
MTHGRIVAGSDFGQTVRDEGVFAALSLARGLRHGSSTAFRPLQLLRLSAAQTLWTNLHTRQPALYRRQQHFRTLQ